MVNKICHLLISYGNKNQKYTSDLIEGLNRFSDGEHFVFCHYAYIETDHTRVIVSHNNIRKVSIFFKMIRIYATNKNFRTLFKTSNLRELSKWIWLISYKINVLHIHHEHAVPLEILNFFKVEDVKIVMSLRGRDLLLNTDDVQKQQSLRAKMLLSDHVHCISYYMKNELFSRFKINGSVIYRGQPLPDEIHTKKYKTDSNKIKIICVGRLVWEKGHIYLIETVNRLKLLGYSLEVDVFGDGSLKEFLSFRIKQLQLENEIHLKGFLKNEDLKKKYKDYDMAVQPSLSEALSNGLIDFSLHNLPCVISDVGGMTEVVQNGKNGIVFDKKNMMLLDNAILKVKDFDLQKVIEYNNSNKDKFTVKQEINDLLKFYV